MGKYQGLIAGIVLVVLDQLVKIIALRYEPGVIWFNRNFAFGLGGDFVWFLAALAGLVFLIGLAIKKGFVFGLPMMLILGGALGNFIDRVRLGYVVDYFHLGARSFFNLADLMIIVGVLSYGYFIFGDVKR